MKKWDRKSIETVDMQSLREFIQTDDDLQRRRENTHHGVPETGVLETGLDLSLGCSGFFSGTFSPVISGCESSSRVSTLTSELLFASVAFEMDSPCLDLALTKASGNYLETKLA